MNKKPELLAPAGSYERAKIAFMYGADAVYCGTPQLSLRSISELQENDLAKTIEYSHSIGKRVHVAINIFAWDETYEEIKKQHSQYLEQFFEATAKILNNNYAAPKQYPWNDDDLPF